MKHAILFALSCLFLSHLAKAEGMAQDAYTATLLELNRIRPDQNPAYTPGKQQVNARILDKKLSTIGKVEDIVVAPNGKYETILANINATGFREDIALDVVSYVTKPTPDTFTVSLDKDQLKQNMSQLMAATNTASGESGPFTMKSLQNAEVIKQDGTPIAKVKDVLVDNKAMQIVSLLVTINSGSTRGKTIAIPYEAANARLENGKAILTVTDAQASTMQSMATRRY